MNTTPYSLDFIAGIAVGFMLGLIVGFIIWRNAKNSKEAVKRLSDLQVLSVFIFFTYIGFVYAIGERPSEFITLAILSMIGGEAIGGAIQRILEKK